MKYVLTSLFVCCLFIPQMADAADFFIDRCGGKKVRATTLSRACKKNLRKTVVKCRRKCVKRKRLKCIKRVWKLIKSKSCGVNNGSSRNQMKTRKCSSAQISKLKSDYRSAKSRALRIRSGVERELRKKHGKKTMRQLKRVKRWINAIIRKRNRRVRFTCKGNKGMCKGANAHTVAFVGTGVRFCDGYFSCNRQDYRAAVIVHELAHKSGANDKVYFSSCYSSRSKSFPKSLKTWSRTAESYEYWARFGFCIPHKTCPK